MAHSVEDTSNGGAQRRLVPPHEVWNPAHPGDVLPWRGDAEGERDEAEEIAGLWCSYRGDDVRDGLAFGAGNACPGLAKEFSYPSRALSIVESWLALSRKSGDVRRAAMLETEKAALAKSVEAAASGTGTGAGGGVHA